MRKIFVVMLVFAGFCGSLAAQTTPVDTRIIGTFRNDKEGTTFVFNADGTVAMIGDAETVQKAMEEERRQGGTVDEGTMTDRLTGTWSIRGKSVDIIFREDGKDNKMSMTIVNNDTLRLGFLMFSVEYRRVAQ